MSPSNDNMQILLSLSGPSKAERLDALNKLQDFIDAEVLQLLLDIENVKLDLVDYRNKERFLENLLRFIPTQPDETVNYIFHHLLGTLYINFEKFWGPTVRMLTDSLKVTKIKKRLLLSLIDHLVRTNNYIYQGSPQDLSKDRPDHVLHRNFILQLLAKFPEFVESNCTTFMDQLFLFVNKELLVSPFIEKLTRQNICSDEDSRQRPVIQVQKSKETLITMFRILQSFQNMSTVHRQEEVKKFLFELLVSRDASVQKVAFNCLTAFDLKSLAPYADKILKLLDEKKARSELSLFSIDYENSQVHPEHRDQLIPVIQRVLFGRMISKVDKKTSGRDKADNRKAIVMRYISGCTTEEILDFFGLLFDPFHKFTDTPYDELEKVLRDNLDIKSYMPLNKLQAILGSLEAYLTSVAHQKEDTLPKLFKLINIVTFYIITPIEDETMSMHINKYKLENLRNLRRLCLSLVINFFESAPYYNYSDQELNFIFKTLIWPSSRSFIDRNYATVTPILRLVNVFVQNDTYHNLLVKRNHQDENEFLLNHVMNLYSDPKVERSVSLYIARMVAKLLNIKLDDEVEVEDDSMDCEESAHSNYLAPTYDADLYVVEGEIPFGLRMIMSYIPQIFDRLRMNCERAIEKKDVSYRLDNIELEVLSRLSVYIKDSAQCLLATRLLLSTLDSQKSGSLIINTLKTVQALMSHVTSLGDPMIVNFIANVLSYQRNIEQRKQLSSLVCILAKIDDRLAPTSRAISLMNTTHDDLVDLPDLAKWNEGFRIAFDYLENLDSAAMNDPDIISNSLTLLIHQVGFIINTVDKYEFSIRENCLIFYEKLAASLSLMEKQCPVIKELLDETILDKFIKKGLRETNDTIKHIYIGILRVLAMTCPDKSYILREFNMFCDTNQDLDFWVNIRHIQLHNRSKALARLVANKDIEKVNPKTLSSYFMPIADGFMFNKNYKSLASLSENSIKLIGIICKQLNWITYESTLSYYLDMLTKANTTYQRTNIKLITEIIKNFNFDITACSEAMELEEENAKLEKRMKKRCGEADGQEVIQDNDVGGKRKLNASTAKMVYYSVTKKLIPRLNSCLNEMTRVDFEYDKKMSNYLPEKDEIKRIPMAFAIVQLLNLLPCRYVLLRDQLPPVFLKLVTFLRSKNEPTRKAARATLLRIMEFLGPAYLPDVLRILRQNLDKGFYVHVLNYTVHSILCKLTLNYGDIDNSCKDLVDMCKQEIFGQVSEDKEVGKVLAKTVEARKTKSYDTLLILASHISVEKLSCLVDPIRDLLKTSNSAKTVNKLSVCVQRIWTGLAQNEKFPLDQLLGFIQSSIEESIPNLRVRQKVDVADSLNSASNGPLREDRFLIGKDKTKDRVRSKINEKGNLHMIVENSLKLLSSTFEKNKTTIKKCDILQKKLDELIPLLTTCLKSSSPRCVTRALKCISFIAQTKIDLPNFKTKANSIVKKIFILLNLYNGVGMVQGDNYDMIGMCFRTLTLLLLKCEHVRLDPKQLSALMSYIEQDLNDATRQATAFQALNSILHKGFEAPELAAVMDKVADLLVTSGEDSVRLQSIRIWQTYLLEYKHDANKLHAHLTKFLRQIDYEYIDGRRSVLGMLRVIVEKFPERILRNYFELFLQLLAQRVVNDESREIRVAVGQLIALLLQRLPETQDKVLKKFIRPWTSSSCLELNMLGLKLMSILIEANQSMFEKKPEYLATALNVVSDALDSDKHKAALAVAKTNGKSNGLEEVEDVMETDENNSPEEDTPAPTRLATVQDKLVYHALRLFKRLLDKELITCTETRYVEQLKKIWQNIATSKLTDWYEPVVVTSCELYLTFISKTTLNQSLIDSNSTDDEYLNWNATRIVRVLCDKFIELVDKYNEKSIIFNYSMQCLVLLGQMVANSKATHEFEQSYLEACKDCDILDYMLSLEELPSDGFVKEFLPYQTAEAKKKADLMWLSIKIVMQARKEAAVHRLSQSHRRDFVLRWLAAVAQELGSERIMPYVFLFMMAPVRELTDKVKIKSERDTSAAGSSSSSSSLLKNLVPMSEDLLKFIKGLTGVECFNKIYSKVQLYYTKKRVNRKKTEALARVKDQTRGVRRKLEESKRKRSKNIKRRKRIAV